MNYIWETVLLAKKEGLDEQKLHFRAAENPSPYIEVSFDDLNTDSLEEQSIDINPLYRFAEVFAKILDRNISEYKMTREIFLDVVLHYIAHTDLRMGLQKQEYYQQFLRQEIKDGVFGKKAQNALELFDNKEKKYLVTSLYDLYRSGNDIRIFIKVMKRCYPNSVIYISQDRANEILVYVGTKKSEKEREKIEFLKDTFLSVGDTVRFFFLNHFGIIDVEKTMILDQLLLI